MTYHSERARVENEAATWAVLLADDPHNKEQLRQFKIWLNASPLHAQVWARTLRVYRGLGMLPPTTQAQWPQSAPGERRRRGSRNGSEKRSGEAVGPINSLTIDTNSRAGSAQFHGKTRHGKTRPTHWKAALATLAIPLCLMLVFLPRLSLHLAADHVSTTGERQTHVLEDGSTLTLAPESAVDIRYSDAERRIQLLKGAAFFDVQRDSERAFVVQAGSTHIAVLGTAFNVDRSDSGTRVSAAHGRVRVEDHSVNPAVFEDLTAGEQLAVTWGQGASRTRIAVDDVARWRRGEVVARDLTVSELVDSFRPYYGGAIWVMPPFASQRVTGLYRLDDPVATLRNMASAHNASARQISPWLLVLAQ